MTFNCRCFCCRQIENVFLDWNLDLNVLLNDREFFVYCREGKKEKLKQYVAKYRNYINVNEKRGAGRNTALHFAVHGNHLHIVHYILQTFSKDLDLKCKNSDGLIPLDLAIKKKSTDIAMAILSDKRTDPEFSSVVLATRTNQTDIANALTKIRIRKRLTRRLYPTEREEQTVKSQVYESCVKYLFRKYDMLNWKYHYLFFTIPTVVFLIVGLAAHASIGLTLTLLLLFLLRLLLEFLFMIFPIVWNFLQLR